MRRLTLLIACLALILPTAAALASGSSGAGIPRSSGGEQPFSVTKQLKCTIIEVQANNLIKVRDDRSGKESLIQLSEQIPLKAQNKKQFGGRKNLQASDLVEGHRILVTKRTDAEVIVRIKVLKDKAKA